MSSFLSVERQIQTVRPAGAPEVRPSRDVAGGPPPPWMEDLQREYIFQFDRKIELFTNAIKNIQEKYLEHPKTENLISAQENILLANLLMFLGWLTVERESSVPLLTSIRTTIGQILGEEESLPDRLQLDSELEQLDTWIISLLKYAKWDQPT